MARLTDTALLELRAELDAAGCHGGGSLAGRDEALLRDLAGRDDLGSLIDRMLPDDTLLAEIAARSYYHVNSFLKLVLMVGDENAWKLRLHVWHPGSATDPQPREDIHSHRWDFTTALVLGEYNAREYSIAAGPEYHHYRYTPVKADQSFALESRGTEQLAQVFEAHLPAGTVYRLDHRVLHSVARATDAPVATVVLQGPAVTDSTNVYRSMPISTQGGGETHVERPSVDQLRFELAQLRRWL